MATLEKAVEAVESDTWDITSSMQHADDPEISEAFEEFEEYSVIEAKKYHSQAEQDDPVTNRSYFARVSGSVLSSGKKGCFKIIEFVAGEAKLIGNQVIHAFSTTPELPPSITGTCQLILDTIKKRNNNDILVQEKWLDETEYLLENKVLTIGVFGRHNAGKSTILNALLYHEVLSVANTNETAFILRICHKPSDHHGSSCFKDTEQFLSMKEEEEVKGRRNIRRAIQERNTDIRDNAATISVDELEAHVPFLCCCATDDIDIVLLDTPGLSESNELGISEASEHQLMTCSAYVYVISSQQLEDSIDTDSLRAIVMRDPNIFEERRIIIAVTRLDLYNTKPKDESDSDSDSDDESSPGIDEEETLKRIESIKEVVQRQCKCLGVPVPNDCIIPLHATGALKARKKIIKVKNKKPIQESKLSTAEGRERVSQVPLLEKKLIEIADKSRYLWHYNIVRDCYRYLDQAMRKLDETKEGFVKVKKKFTGKVKIKEDIMNDCKKIAENLISNYNKGSKFCSELEAAYDKDIKENFSKIDEVSRSHLEIFQKFQSDLESRRSVTTEQFNSEATEIIEAENESLTDDLKDLPFREVDAAVCKSMYQIGTIRQQLEQCLASYCDTATSTCEDPHLQKNAIISESISDSGIAVDSPHLKLSDLLEQSKVHYNFFDRIKNFFKNFFVAPDDPNHNLLKPEIDAFLKELEKHFLSECHNYFQKIKPKIVEGYLKQHREIAEEHIADVAQHYLEQRRTMDAQVRAWRKQARFHKKMMKSHSDLIDNLEKQKKHLVALAERHHNISLSSKHLQDE